MALLLLYCVLRLPAWGNESTPAEDAQDPPSRHTTVPYFLAALDRVEIREPNQELQSYKISQDGTLTANDITIHLIGLSTTDARRLLLQKLHLNPQTSIQFHEFHLNRFSILGEVYHQINREMNEGPMRVLDAVGLASGFTALANTRDVKLMREDAGNVTIYELDIHAVMLGKKLSHNLVLEPGDVITVGKNFL